MNILTLTLAIHVALLDAFFFGKGTVSAPQNDYSPEEDNYRGIPLYFREKYDADIFECDHGSRKLDKSSVNDNFCDCADGSDEPSTGSCANGKFYCENKGYRTIQIPSSRVDDGICDCCDGSDEGRIVKCGNTCNAAASKERAAMDRLINDFKTGSRIRENYLDSMRMEKTEKELNIERLRAEKKEQKSITEKIAADLEQAKQQQLELEKEIREKTTKEVKSILRLDAMNQNDIPALTAAFFRVLNLSGTDVDREISFLRAPFEGSVASHFPSPPPPIKIEEDEVEPQGTHLSDEHRSVYDDEDYSYAQHSEDRDYDGDVGQAEVDYEGSTMTPPVEPPAETTEELERINNCVYLTQTFPDDIQKAHVRTFCKSFPADSMVEETKRLLLHILETKRNFAEIQLLFGYFNLNGRLYGAEAFVEVHMKTLGPTVCPDTFAMSKSIDLCAVARGLEAAYSSLAEAPSATSCSELNSQHVEAQAKLNDLTSALRDAKSAIREMEKYKDNLEYLAIKGQCFDTKDGKFTYRLCVMDKVLQIEDGGSSQVTLGYFDAITIDNASTSSTMMFNNGDYCHAFGSRSAEVSITCAGENSLTSAREPSTCAYHLTFQSPAACTPEFALAKGVSLPPPTAKTAAAVA